MNNFNGICSYRIVISFLKSLIYYYFFFFILMYFYFLEKLLFSCLYLANSFRRISRLSLYTIIYMNVPKRLYNNIYSAYIKEKVPYGFSFLMYWFKEFINEIQSILYYFMYSCTKRISFEFDINILYYYYEFFFFF